VDVRKELYIGGRRVEPTGDGDVDVIDSRTEDVMGRGPRGELTSLQLPARS
jgi:hypothetical protein